MRYQNKQPKRQFIAGAVCQACGATDTTALHISYDDNGNLQEYIACSVCDFTENRPSDEELLAIQAKKEQQATDAVKQQQNAISAVKFKF